MVVRWPLLLLLKIYEHLTPATQTAPLTGHILIFIHCFYPNGTPARGQALHTCHHNTCLSAEILRPLPGVNFYKYFACSTDVFHTLENCNKFIILGSNSTHLCDVIARNSALLAGSLRSSRTKALYGGTAGLPHCIFFVILPPGHVVETPFY